jgi:peroxiredoxin
VLTDVYDAHRDDDLALVAISVQETTADDVRAYVERYQLPYTVGFDVTSAVFHTYRAYVLPTQIFIDRDGIVRNVTLGQLSREAAEAILAPILAD